MLVDCALHFGDVYQRVTKIPFSSEGLWRDHTPVVRKVGSTVLGLFQGGCKVKNYFHSNSETAFAFPTVLTFALMVQKPLLGKPAGAFAGVKAEAQTVLTGGKKAIFTLLL